MEEEEREKYHRWESEGWPLPAFSLIRGLWRGLLTPPSNSAHIRNNGRDEEKYSFLPFDHSRIDPLTLHLLRIIEPNVPAAAAVRTWGGHFPRFCGR